MGGGSILCGVGFHYMQAHERSSMDDQTRKDCMIRIALCIVAVLDLAGAPMASAQTAPPESVNPRYTFNRMADGYLRLDCRAGEVSIFAQGTAASSCHVT